MRTLTTRAALLAVALTLGMAATASAEWRGGGRIVVVPRAYVHTPFFYDPFWGPYPYGYYMYGGRPQADVRGEVKPKRAEVFVDGYYAGVAEDFDGAFKRLHTSPGGHAITLYLEGYRTVTENVYVRPGSTFKLKDTMERLAPGEMSQAPPPPARRLNG